MAREVSIPAEFVYAWESQVKQYDLRGKPGIVQERHALGELGALDIVDCLLWRDDLGLLRGILNYYQTDNEFEQAGNCNIWVDPGWQRTGVGTELVREALRRWDIDPDRQRYTEAGLAFVAAVERQIIAEGLVDGQHRKGSV